MFAFSQTTGGELLYFEFGAPLDPDFSPEERVRAIMKDYSRCRDELFDMFPNEVAAPLFRSMMTAEASLDRLKEHLEAMGRQRSTSVAEIISGYLGHPDADVRREAILATGRIGSFKELPKLELFLSDPGEVLREAAMIALSRSLDAEVIDKVRAAAGANPRLAGVAREAERRFAAIEAGDMRAFTQEVIETSEFEDLLWLQEAVADYLVEILKDPFYSEQTRKRAVWLLSARPVPTAGPAIDRVLRDSGEPLAIRREAARGAGRIKRRAFVPALAELVGNEDLELARLAAEALGKIGAAAGLPPLLERWGDQDGALRPAILLAIRRICKYPARWVARITQAKGELTMERIWFIRDAELLDTFQPGLVYEALGSSNVEARRDAILLLTFWGRPPDVRRLARLEQTETDAENRQLAALGVERLGRGPM